MRCRFDICTQTDLLINLLLFVCLLAFFLNRYYDYIKVKKIDDVLYIPGIRPNGYVIKFPVYILSASDAYVIMFMNNNSGIY